MVEFVKCLWSGYSVVVLYLQHCPFHRVGADAGCLMGWLETCLAILCWIFSMPLPLFHHLLESLILFLFPGMMLANN